MLANKLILAATVTVGTATDRVDSLPGVGNVRCGDCSYDGSDLGGTHIAQGFYLCSCEVDVERGADDRSTGLGVVLRDVSMRS
jgi:hypothetical protein